MPIHIPPTTRRRFIRQFGTAVAIMPFAPLRAADTDADLIAIFNDTHIGGAQPGDSQNPRHLAAAVNYILGLPARPNALVINGDLALRDGQPADYEHFAKLILPLREAGVPVHLTLGNHDNREVFYRVLTAERPAAPAIASRHVGVVQLPKANLFLLDSLKETMIAQGDLGSAQAEWLAKMLDEHRDRPAIIVAHHNPRLGGDPKHYPGGLIDSEPLWQMLEQRPHVKAYIHGHIHDRGYSSHRGIHIINTPAISYVADPALSTTGWTLARLHDKAATLTTLTHLPDHEWNNRSESLEWR